MSPFARAYVCINYEKTKGTFSCEYYVSVLGKQIVQAIEVYSFCLHEIIVIKTSDKKYERRFDRSTVIFKFKFMDKRIPHIYNFWKNGIKGKKQVFAYKQ